ncbi:hypothetical protein [Sphingobacterium sp.]|uniref:hypothetical protein n=1 Tax=Sphingobacterium sp. TaxID=341027 RepID=UPI0028A6F8F9|nr:hypothetical protein [Sphingobacterium sp.]
MFELNHSPDEAIDAISSKFTSKALQGPLKESKRKIKAFLMDQALWVIKALHMQTKFFTLLQYHLSLSLRIYPKKQIADPLKAISQVVQEG